MRHQRLPLFAPFCTPCKSGIVVQMGHNTSIFDNSWPSYDEDKMKDSETDSFQSMEKQGTIMIEVDAPKDNVLSIAKEVFR